MKNEAKANEESDKAERERIEKINQADSLIFQTEKQLKEYGDKVPADKKAPIEAALAELKEAHKSQDLARIEAGTAKLNEAWTAASQEIYNAMNQQGGAEAQPGADAGAQQGGAKSDTVEDAQFEEVK